MRCQLRSIFPTSNVLRMRSKVWTRPRFTGFPGLLNNVLVRLVKLAVAREALEARKWVDELLAHQSDAVVTIPHGLQRHLDLPKICKVAKNVSRRSLRSAGVDVPALPVACPLTIGDLLDPEFDLEAVVMRMTAAMGSSEPS